MKATSELPSKAHVLAGSLLAFLVCVGAQAAPIELVPNTVNMFRDTRAANNLNIRAGDVFQFGANVAGGSGGTSLNAIYPLTNFTTSPAPCAPLTVSPNFCAAATNFNPNRMAVPWTLRFSRASEADLLASAPSLLGAENPVPFPVNVTISGTGLTPTISWTIPNNFTADAVRINIFDFSKDLENGSFDVILTHAVASNLLSYTIPSNVLQMGGNYSFSVQLIDTRGDPAVFVANNNNAEILRRSSSYFNFSPLDSNAPPNVYLPTVVDGVYNFSITEVGPNSITFIDPFVAIGYDYATAEGDPNFASVLLPTGIGDNLFDLYLWDGLQFADSGIDLMGGSQYFFDAVGLSRFSIRGIETSAALDPNNVTAFITGLTFVREGEFNGTMTPITAEVSVPEPGTLILLLTAALGMAGCRRGFNAPERRPQIRYGKSRGA